MLDAVQGRDTSVRGTISKGRFVQGAQHPRISSREHIGRGLINPAGGASLNGELDLQSLFGLHVHSWSRISYSLLRIGNAQRSLFLLLVQGSGLSISDKFLNRILNH